MKLGCHVSNNGKLMLEGSVKEAVSYGANTFMVYLGAPQNSYRKKASELNIEGMKKALAENQIAVEDVIVHASYLINLAQSDLSKRQFGIDFLTREIKTMDEIGAKYLVIHPGAHMMLGIEEGLKLIIESLKQIFENTKESNVSIAIETMAGKGSECCSLFTQIKQVLDGVNNKRLCVCFDTCHVHDAGYDIINDYQNVMKSFDNLIGFDKLRVFHINDSKNIKGSKKDRHENIGFGEIGFNALMQFVYDERFVDIPKILETPYVESEEEEYSPYKYEIEMIKNNQFDCNLIEKIKRG